MAWKTIDRQTPAEAGEGPVLSEALREKIKGMFPRYETKRAVLLPALHMVQDELGHIGFAAQQEVAELLEINASDVFDVVTFYTYFWDHPKGRKVITVCRSIACEVLGANEILDEVQNVLGIGDHETTPDGEYSLLTEECLAACDHGPCLFINEREYKCVRPDQIRTILADKENDKLDIPRTNLYDGPTKAGKQ